MNRIKCVDEISSGNLTSDNVVEFIKLRDRVNEAEFALQDRIVLIEQNYQIGKNGNTKSCLAPHRGNGPDQIELRDDGQMIVAWFDGIWLEFPVYLFDMTNEDQIGFFRTRALEEKAREEAHNAKEQEQRKNTETDRDRAEYERLKKIFEPEDKPCTIYNKTTGKCRCWRAGWIDGSHDDPSCEFL